MSTSTNTLGKYQIIREIARSNDVVYEALDPSLNRRVALKELSIPPNVTGAQKRDRVERFLREGRAAGKLAHPNIVTIYDVGKENDRYYIAMEYLEGQTLRDTLQAGGPLSMSDAVNYTLQLCSALAYAHQHEIIHRDIKPDNVQILPGGHVKLTDFGIARLMSESSITQDGQVFGTPSYMSPEQVAGKKMDTRSDIFSVGVMLYEMIAGKKPFAGDSVVTITYNIVNMEPTPPPGAPPYITGVIRKAMAKDPNARYSTIDEMAQDIRDERAGDGLAPLGVWPGQVSAPDPFQQASQFPQPPLTPYGTPMPSQNAGLAPGQAPNPFAQNAPVAIPVPLPPRRSSPVMSAETKNFLGIFLLVIGATGMIVFAIWAVNLAYGSFQTATTSAPAMQHYEAGEKAYTSGNYDLAMREWSQAVNISPHSKVAENAKERLFDLCVMLARKSYELRDSAGLEIQAKALVNAKPTRPEGYFYTGAAADLKSDLDKAKENYVKTIDLGGTDAYAQAARQRVGPLFLEDGDTYAASGQLDSAMQAYQSAKNYGDSQTFDAAQQKIADLTYKH